MKDSPGKDFGAIESDYDFFIASSNEHQCDLEAYMRRVGTLAGMGGPIRMLDVGCGNGEFTDTVLTMADWPADRLALCLVEPVNSQRCHAAERLQRFTAAPITHWPLMPSTPVGPFDLVLANHVLYYVDDLDETVERIMACLAPGGRWLIAMGGRTNALIVFWEHVSAQTGRPIPHHLSEELEDVFARRGIAYERDDVTYEMAFPDSTENRMRILRFLLGERIKEVAVPRLLEMFDPWSRDGRIVTAIGHYHYTVRGPES